MKAMNSSANVMRSALSSLVNSRGDKFSSEGAIYIAPTSNVKDMCNLFSNYGSVLTVGGGGGIPFEALLRGAKNVECFDINKRQRAYFDLLCTSIRNLSYEDFCRFFSMDGKQFMSPLILDVLGFFFEEDENRAILEPLFYFNKKDNFRYDYDVRMSFLTRFTSYYNKEDYERLQKELYDKRINFEVCDISDVPKVFEGKKYDLIFLDNILQYYKNIAMLDSGYKVNNFIKKDLSKLLNDDGIIQVNYGFQLAAAALDSSKPFVLDSDKLYNSSFMSKQMIEVEKKEGINGLLLAKGDYDYEFIPGVEVELAEKASNVVLTYKKR